MRFRRRRQEFFKEGWDNPPALRPIPSPARMVRRVKFMTQPLLRRRDFFQLNFSPRLFPGEKVAVPEYLAGLNTTVFRYAAHRLSGLDCQDNFAELCAGFQIFVRGGGFF